MVKVEKCCFPNLRSLDLRGNNNIEFDLDCLTEKCQLKNNAANERNKSLEHMCLEEFREIKGSFSNFVNLQTLILLRNSLELHAGMFKGLTNLKILFIKDINHKMISPGVFDGLVYLEELLLSISDSLNFELSQKTLVGVENLKLLMLYGIKDIDLDAFSSMRDLEYVCLDKKELIERLEPKYPNITFKFNKSP